MKKTISIMAFLCCSLVAVAQQGTKENPVMASININTKTGHTIVPGASGFNVRIGDKVWSYKHPDFIKAVKELKPGWLRYWSGTAGDAFCMGTGLYDKEYISMFDKGEAYDKLYQFLEVKGPHRITDLYNLMGEVGGKIVVTINGFTETPEMTEELARFCKNNNIIVDIWQFCNEPYFYIPTRQRYWWNDGYDYAQKMKPHADAIRKVFPDAKMALNFTWDGIWDFMKQINRYQKEKGAFWNVFSKHSYAPHVGGNEDFDKAYQRGNSKLIEVTSDDAMKDIEQWTQPGIPMLITEFGVWNKPLNGIYSAIYNAEYTLRQLSHPNTYLIGSHEVSNKFKPAKNFNEEILKAYQDEKPLNTLALQTGIEKTDEGKAMQILHKAINNSNYIYETIVQSAIMVDGMKGIKAEGNYAMALKGINGFDYLAITNRSGSYQQFSLIEDGKPLSANFEKQLMWSAEAQKENIPTSTETLSGNKIDVPPYALVLLKWKTGANNVPQATRIYNAKIVKDGIQLSWWKNETATGYEITCTDENGKSKKVNAGKDNSYTIKELVRNKEYQFTVSVLNLVGKSGPSEKAALRFALPSSPSIFKTAPRDKEVTVFWHSVPNATGYKIIVQSNDDSYKKELDADNVFGYKIKGLEFDKLYTISVKAYNDLGESNTSGTVTVTCKKNIPLPAYNISAIENMDGNIDLKWNVPKEIVPGIKYRVYRGVELYHLQLLVDNLDSTNYTDKSIVKGKEYFYSVKAYTADGENSFFPNTATIIRSTNQSSVTVTKIKQQDGETRITVNFNNVAVDGDVVYGVSLSDVSYLNGEEPRFTTDKISGNEFTVTIPAGKLVTGRTYAVKGFVQTNAGTPVTSLPPLKEFKVE
jgi:fibronectin type 3 domain-containing protein